MDIGFHIDDYRDYLTHERKLSRNTVISYVLDLRRFAEWLGPNDLRSIGRDQVRGYIRYLSKRDVAVATIRRRIYSLSTFFKWAHVEGYGVHEIPTLHITLPRKEVKAPQWLAEGEVAALIIACNNPSRGQQKIALAIKLLLFTGMRPGEMLSLRRENVHDDAIVVRNTKSRRDRVIPIHEQLKPALLSWIQDMQPDERLFRFKSRQAFYHLYHRFLKRHGLPDVFPYALRHSFGTYLALANVQPHVIKDLMGHTSIATTQTYLHARPSHLKEGMGKLYTA